MNTFWKIERKLHKFITADFDGVFSSAGKLAESCMSSEAFCSLNSRYLRGKIQ